MSDSVIEKLREKKGFICDMDGVIYHGNSILKGVDKFVEWLLNENKNFLFLTNSSERTPKELQQKLERMGLEVDESHFYTSALATAQFLKNQAQEKTVFAIGEAGLLNALYDVGFTMNDVNPEYVVMGETRNYNFENMMKAVQLVEKGAKLIGTNPDISAPSESGLIPACRALISPIEMVTGKSAYFVGKPNPLMMRTGMKLLGVHSQDAVMIGDRMDTDIIAGIESGMETILVLSGVSAIKTVEEFPYRPTCILKGVGDVAP